ncbi:MAG: UPF0182 family protein [Clostridia bacterium]|nr:UPF0182 family protein [Clostridia bacterium]
MNKKVSSNSTLNKDNAVYRKIAVILFIILFIVGNVISLRGEYLSIKQIDENYIEIFFKNLSIEWTVFSINFVVIFILFYITNKIIHKGLKIFFDDDKKEMPKLPNKSIAFIIAIISSFIAKNMLAEKYMLFSNVAWFGTTDPIFNNDIGYYMFVLPFIEAVFVYVFGIIVLNLVYIAIYNIITFNFYLNGVDRELLKKSIFIKQVMFVSFLLIIAFSAFIWKNSENILTQNLITIEDAQKTDLIGAGASDITVKIIGYRILSVIIIFVALGVIKCIKKSNLKKGAATVLIIPIYLIGLFFVTLYVDYIYMGPNEFDKQKDYIGYNIDFTKKAYGIDIDQVDLKNYDTITRKQVEDNQEFVNNIPLFTKDLIEQTLEQKQEDSMYYSYNKNRLAYYEINGNKQLVYLTPKEIITKNRTYNNLTYEYTHGYSVNLTSVSNVDKTGYPEIIQPNNKFVKQPRIYFGLENNSEIIVNSDYGNEYDYLISANEKDENVYDGEAGLKLNFWDRLILGLKNGNFKLAFSKYINENSKIISERNIVDRVNELLPNIMYDEPYLVVSENGNLIWVIDGYTTSKEYPYSQFATCPNGEKINYIRNSVKVLIDAYNGTTKYYITDENDPIINLYSNLYPSLFVDKSETIPTDISKQFTYPELLYNVQSKMINLYHGTSEDVLYRGDNVWQITTETVNKNSTIEPYFTLVNTIDSEESELGLMVTYNKYGKQSMTAYLVGTCKNGKNNLTLYKFDSESTVAGISQVNKQIEQDENISKELEVLNTPGTKLLREMEIIPIENTLLYVEKVYRIMLNEPEGIPSLEKIIVASGNVLAMGDSLQDAIYNLYSDDSIELDFYDAGDMDALIDSIIKAHHNLKDSLDAQDFEMIGKDLSSLESLLEQLEILQEQNKSLQNEELKDFTTKLQSEIKESEYSN